MPALDGEITYEELAEQIIDNSPYKRKPTEQRKMMSVLEMESLLSVLTDEERSVVERLFLDERYITELEDELSVIERIQKICSCSCNMLR